METTGTEPTPDHGASAAPDLAPAFHEEWRSHRALPGGGFEPRVKPTVDDRRPLSHGVREVDIANTAYVDLPEEWQIENRRAAEVVAQILDAYSELDLNDQAQRSTVGGQVHDAWLARNRWAAGGTLDVPFDELPVDEQNRDVNQIVTALALRGGNLAR